MQMIDVLLKYILWHEPECPKWLRQKNCHKRTGQVEPFLSKYALVESRENRRKNKQIDGTSVLVNQYMLDTKKGPKSGSSWSKVEF